MAKIMRIVADTQIPIAPPIRLMGARLVHTGATTCDIYDEADSSKTAACKKIALSTADTYIFKDDVNMPRDGIVFTKGMHVDWTAGEVFLTFPDEYTDA